ncbi:phage virion morphogenesis protein [Brevundimonas sp.]|uniref:phage virion morphogenesis protein n=1 Tax=Brevundimonas sp. TaxID=1871086 RepID=UPI003D6D7CE0
MVSSGITLDGIVRAQRTMAELLDRTGDLEPLMGRIGAYGEESTVHRFETQKGPDGDPWEPSLRAKATGGQTLVDSGRLRQSMTWNASRDSAEWGTNLIYAGVHQDGATIAAKGDGHLGFVIPGIGFRSPKEVVIPARPFLGVDADDEDEIDDIVQDYIAEVLP